MKNSAKINFLFLSALYLVSSGYSNSSLNIYPVFFSTYKSSGGEWNYQNKPIIINGFGLGAKNIFNNWILEAQYIQISLLGNINNDIMQENLIGIGDQALEAFKYQIKLLLILNLGLIGILKII